MCTTTEVTAYKDCKGDLHASKMNAYISNITSSLNAARVVGCYATSRISTYDMKEAIKIIMNSDEMRGYFREAIKDKDEERNAELTKTFCDYSKSC